MRSIHGLVIASLTPILVNCSIHPLIDDVTRTTTHDIVEKIRCEAQRAVRDHGQGLTSNATIAYEFTFEITETNNASGDVTWSIPSLSGNFSLTAKAGSDLTRKSVRNFKIVDTFDDLRAANCDPRELEKNWIYPIAGDIGIYEVIETFTKLNVADHPVDKEVFTFHDTLTFTTNFGGGVQPTLTLKPVKDRFRVTQAKADLKARRIDIHKVVLALIAKPGLVTVAGRKRTTVARTFNSRSAGYNSNLATTLLQTGGDLRQSALYELDRARIRELQDRIQTQVVGP